MMGGIISYDPIIIQLQQPHRSTALRGRFAPVTCDGATVAHGKRQLYPIRFLNNTFLVFVTSPPIRM